MLEHDERIATALRTVSDDVHARPTLVADVRRGALRRRRRNRVVGGTAVAVGATLVASAVAAGGLRLVAGPANNVDTGGPSASASASAAPAPVNCRVEKLPVPAGYQRSIVTGGDPSGRFLVGRAYASDEERPLLIWDGDRMTRVDMPGVDEIFEDINGAGAAVGASYGEGNRQSAYVYRDGKLSRLQAPTRGVKATAISENGTIVGTGGDGDELYRPLVWRDAAAPAQPLALPDGYPSGSAGDVDADGTILGTVSKEASPGVYRIDRGYIWKPDGTGRLLPLPQIDGKPAQSLWLTSIHNGIVFGSAITREATTLGPRPGAASAAPGHMMKSHPLLFDLRTERYTMLTQAAGTVGNTMGWMVQQANTSYVAAPTGRADLPSLGSPGDDGASFMSADGLVIGGKSNDANGQMQAVRWRCATRG